MKESMENPDRIAPARQLSIMQAVKNQEGVTEQDRKQSHQLHKSQLIWSNSIHYHGLPSSFFDCSAELFPKLFPDSKITQEWGKKAGTGTQKNSFYFVNAIKGSILKYN